MIAKFWAELGVQYWDGYRIDEISQYGDYPTAPKECPIVMFSGTDLAERVGVARHVGVFPHGLIPEFWLARAEITVQSEYAQCSFSLVFSENGWEVWPVIRVP